MFFIFLKYLRVDEYIIQVINYKLIKVISNYVINSGLKCY